jgi:hypothetical protein
MGPTDVLITAFGRQAQILVTTLTNVGKKYPFPWHVLFDGTTLATKSRGCSTSSFNSYIMFPPVSSDSQIEYNFHGPVFLVTRDTFPLVISFEIDSP